MKVVNFSKAVASGNDFIIIKNRKLSPESLKMLAQRLCLPKYGIGADGLLIAERSRKADLRMKIFNPDGSQAEMCGNGIRCFILWAYRKGLVKRKSFIETLAGIIEGNVKTGNYIEVKLKATFEHIPDIKIVFRGNVLKGDYIDTGVPHFVIEVKNLQSIDVVTLGKFVRYHKLFKPRGTNVDFVKYKKNDIYVRTYERGVEDETLSCGTGCVAAALVVGRRKGYDFKKFTLIPKSREKLKVSYKFIENKFQDVYLESKARILFEGKFYLH